MSGAISGEWRGMVRIRRLENGDEVEWLRLRMALWPHDATDELLRGMAVIREDPRQPVFVAERPEGGLCGLLEAAIRPTAPGCVTPNVGYLEGWYVDPDRRGRGIGRRLVEAAEAWARSEGCREMASDTTPNYPVSPIAHARLGYEPVEDPYHFRKELGVTMDDDRPPTTDDRPPTMDDRPPMTDQ